MLVEDKVAVRIVVDSLVGVGHHVERIQVEVDTVVEVDKIVEVDKVVADKAVADNLVEVGKVADNLQEVDSMAVGSWWIC